MVIGQRRETTESLDDAAYQVSSFVSYLLIIEYQNTLPKCAGTMEAKKLAPTITFWRFSLFEE